MLSLLPVPNHNFHIVWHGRKKDVQMSNQYYFFVTRTTSSEPFQKFYVVLMGLNLCEQPVSSKVIYCENNCAANILKLQYFVDLAGGAI